MTINRSLYLGGEPGGGGGGSSASLSVSPVCWVMTVTRTFLYFFFLVPFATSGPAAGGTVTLAPHAGKFWSGDPWPGRTPVAKPH